MNIIEQIQQEDPSYDPLTAALLQTRSHITLGLYKAACDRIYYDGYYGPVSSDEWAEQDGRQPYSVKEALNIVAEVLQNVEDYYDIEYCDPDEGLETNCTGHRVWDSKVESHEIKSALIPWFKEIYGYGYPS